MADISNLVPTAREIEIKHPVTDDPIGIRIDLCSIDDPKLKALKRQMTDKRNKAAMKGSPLKASDIEQNENTLMFNACEGWHWYNPTGSEGDDGYDPDAMPDFDGEVPDFNQRNFFRVIDRLQWMRRQIATELDEEKDFFQL